MQCASAAGLPLELTEGAVYRFSSQLELPSGLTIRGNGAVLLSDIQYETLGQDRPAVGIIGRSNEDRAHDIRLENVTFRAADSCQSNCLFWVNENIRFEGCVFRQLTGGVAGGIWVRNWTDQAESRNIRFEDCDFYKSGADEVLAVWGWGSAVREVVLSGCGFYETETEESLAAGNRPVWFITLGQSGITDVRMEHCTIWADRCEVIFHMVGDKTHAVVDNCDITLNQPDDVAGHDIRKSANPMLAQGNGRADGSTVIQNSHIILSGDDGRRISYRLSALKDNTLEVSLGHGIASTSEVSGNTIRGRIQHKIFEDCSNVWNNHVNVRRFSLPG